MRTLGALRTFYEDFWEDAPADPEPYAWDARRALLLGEVRRGERVLDLGCGAGRFLRALREAGADPIGVEIAEAAVERARANVPGADIRLLDADGSLPIGHGEVDVVWCSEVLEHIPDVAATLHEVRRVLKRDGRLLLTSAHFLALPAIIARTDLAVVMPQAIARGFVDAERYALLSAALPRSTFTVSIHWSSRFDTDPAHRWLRRLFIEIGRAHV